MSEKVEATQEEVEEVQSLDIEKADGGYLLSEEALVTLFWFATANSGVSRSYLIGQVCRGERRVVHKSSYADRVRDRLVPAFNGVGGIK